MPRYTSNPFMADNYPPPSYSHQPPYYGGNGQYEQYPPPSMPTSMDEGAEYPQYQPEVRAPQPPMYPRYPPASSYPQMTSYYEPRGYPTGPAEPRAYDPTQPQHAGYAQPQQDPIYMGYGKEVTEAPKPAGPPQYNYSKDFQPIYSGFYSDPSAPFASKAYGVTQIAGPAPSESIDGAQMMGEKKEDAFASSAFSQPLGLGFFPPPKSEEGDANDTKRTFILINTF